MTDNNSCKPQSMMPVNDFDCHKIIDVAEMFLSEEFSSETYQKITDIARQVVSAKYAIFNLYEDNGEDYYSVAVSGAGEVIKKASNLLGFEISKKKWGSDPHKAMKIAGQTITCFDALHDLTGKKIPLPVMLLIEKSFNIGKTYVAKIVKEDKMLGDFTLIYEKGEDIVNEGLMELFVKLTGLFIARKKAEEKLRKSHEQFMLAVEGNHDGIWDWDITTGELFLSARWKEMLGYTNDEIENNIDSFRNNLYPDDRPRVMKYLDGYLKGEYHHYHIEFRMNHKDGSYRWILARGEALYDENDIPCRMAGSHTDVTEKKEMEKQLETLASTDELTGLWNRRYFFEIGHNECKRTRRYKAKFGMLVIDIDHFKDINDTYGHAAGDAVLRNVAEIFRKGLRDVDIPARIGGEEFAVLMPNTDIEGAKIVAERLRSAVESSEVVYEENSLKITISVGISDCTNINSIDEMLKNADDALYEAKRSGRNCFKAKT
jgi:diguanylate cyclase (GGDEF)-like protein/PAS domain S-box-containing protein